jgi:hypothetical protein
MKRRSTIILHGSITQKTTLNTVDLCCRVITIEGGGEYGVPVMA